MRNNVLKIVFFTNRSVEEDLPLCRVAADLVALIIVIMTWYEELQELTNLPSFCLDFKNKPQMSSDLMEST